MSVVCADYILTTLWSLAHCTVAASAYGVQRTSVFNVDANSYVRTLLLRGTVSLVICVEAASWVSFRFYSAVWLANMETNT